MPPGLAPPPDAMGPAGPLVDNVMGGGPPQLPPDLMLQAAAQQQGAAPQPQADPLTALQDAIHSVASAMASLPGAQDTQDAAQALLVLSRIQTRLMGPQSGAPSG